MLRSLVLAIGLVFAVTAASHAQDPEVERLKKRIDDLERKVGDGKVVSDEPGHKRLHPVHSIYGLTFSGSLTATAHGIKRESAFDPKGEAALSADLVVETPVGDKGRAVVVLDFQRGAGLDLGSVGLNLATSPNGAATGYSADLEDFNDDNVHVTQAYYEHTMSERLSFSVGQLDITGYFDANEFANDEKALFLAPLFVNNPAIEFGGSADFYAFGARATFSPTEDLYITFGAFEGDGDYSNAFDKPFYMVEAGYAAKPFGLDGNYRLYYWYRGARPDALSASDPTNASLADEYNLGLGVSFDQKVSDTLGVWLRAGLQREEVAQFDKFAAAGLHISGELFGRSSDHIGFGYGASFMGQNYENYLKGIDPAFDAAPEHYFELYYNYALLGAGPDEGFHISPDFQYIVNPGGDNNADSAFIYGVRLQTYF